MREWILSLDSPYSEMASIMAAVPPGLIFGLITYLILRRFITITGLEKRDFLKIRNPLIFIYIVIFTAPANEASNFNLPWFIQLRSVLLIITLAWFVIEIVSMARVLFMKKFETNKTDIKARKVFTQIRVFERIIVVLIIVISSGLALMSFDSIRQIGVSLLTSAGIAGIIFGLAAQKLLGNLLAGLQLGITQPIRIYDVVIVEGEWGRVEEITLTYVTVRIWDDRCLVLPSTYFIERPFQNWTRSDPAILGTVFIYTDYRMPLEPVREELTRILSNSEFWDGRANNVQVTNCTERTMEIRLLVSAKDGSTAWSLRVEVREKMLVFLQQNYPSMLPRTRIELHSEGIESPSVVGQA
jgi:small-conductance mechanosensitive channel